MGIAKASPARKPATVKRLPLKAGVGRPRGTGAQTVFDALRERILSLELAPHDDIDELLLVKEFGVSRMPVREALIRLSSEGLVELLPNRGPRVSSLNVNEVPQILEALELAQRVVMRWAAGRCSPQAVAEIRQRCEEFSIAAKNSDARSMSETNKRFHLAIGNACGNVQLAGWYESLLNSSMRLARIAYERAPLQGTFYRKYYATVDAEHHQMVEAITRRDAAWRHFWR